MADDAPIWRRIAERDGLAEPRLDRRASAWHTDADLGRPVEVIADMGRSRRLGFTGYRSSDGASIVIRMSSVETASIFETLP